MNSRSNPQTDPRSKDMKDKVNLKVKHRQWFRPFAPSILREYVQDWFEDDVESPYMSFVSKIKEVPFSSSWVVSFWVELG